MAQTPRGGIVARRLCAGAALLPCLWAGSCAPANWHFPRTFHIGPGLEYAMPSEVAPLVGPGDTVMIAPATYKDCAVWPAVAPNLRIIGTGDGAVLSGKTCGDKAIFVVEGKNTLVRGITITGAQATHHNGAGIFMASEKLTIENCRFLDNENGILTTATARAELLIRDSSFVGNGNCIEECAHGIYAGRIARLKIERSAFFSQNAGHHIKSRARRTELYDNDIRDGPEGTSSYLVDLPNGGDLVMLRNTLEKGPLSKNQVAAVMIGAEGELNPTRTIRIRRNHFINDLGQPTIFVGDQTATPAHLTANVLDGAVIPLQGPGTVD